MSDKQSISILIADHNESFSQMASSTFKARQWDVEVVRLGKDVMKRLEDFDPPDVIIMASILPDRNGLELCRAIKGNRDYRAVRIIIISSFPKGSRSFVEAKSRFYADEVLAHPVDVDNLPSFVQNLVAPGTVDKKPEVKKAEPAKVSKPAGALKRERIQEKKTEFPKKPVLIPQSQSFDKGIPLEGRLGKILLPELLLYLYEKRADGMLNIKSLEEERSIYLKNGIPVSIDTNFIVGQSLGPILLMQERITQKELAKAQKEARQDERRLGEVLMDMGLMTHAELMETLDFQAHEKLIRAFKRNEGTYKFVEGAAASGDAGTLDRGILHILLAGIKNHITLSLLEDRIYLNKHRKVMKNSGYKNARMGLQLTRREWAILDLIDGQKTLGEIISKSRLNFIRTFQALYIFYLFGLIYFEDGESAFFQLEESVMHRAIAEAHGDSDRDDAGGQWRVVADGSQSELMKTLYALGGSGATGILSVTTQSARHDITFANGKPVKIISDPSEQHQLGEMLIADKLINARDRDDALNTAQAQEKLIGEVLLKAKKITPYDLYNALINQTETKLLDLLANPKGQELAFQSMEPEGDKTPLEVDMLKVVLAALRTGVSADHIAGELSPYMKSAIQMSGGIQKRVRNNLSDSGDLAVIGAINGKMSIQQIIDTLKKPGRQVMSLMYALHCMSLIEFEQD